MEKPDISDKPDNTDISDKWDGNLENMSGGVPDKPDRLDPSLNVSGLSGRPWGLLEENLRNIPEIRADITDISDKTTSRTYLSDLSGPYTGHFDRNLKNMSPASTDSTDRFALNPNLSVLSAPEYGLSSSVPSYFSNGSVLLDEYEERVAIAEYDGLQALAQAERVAYLDAFMAVLATLPYKDSAEDWLAQRVKDAQNWLLDLGIKKPK
jgi:hypothetical protein